MVDYDTLAREVERIVGAANLVSSDDLPQYAVEGKVPHLVVFPETVDSVAETLALATRMGAKVIPRGGGTKLHWGGIPRQVDIVLGLERLNQILEHEPADLTATIQAGIRMRELQEQLGKKGQFVPLDPPFSYQSTLGGTIATNATGPKRLLYGTARDLLLGVKVVHADGRISRGGGKVVKNVAGYDMNKLYIGSYGTLGVLVEMTMKLLPKPEQEKLLFATFADLPSAVKVASQIFQSNLRPSAIELLNNTAGAFLSRELGITITTGPLILVGIDDIAQAAERQYNQIQRLCIAEESVEIISLSEEKQRTLWSTLRNLSAYLLQDAPETLICRAHVLTNKIGDLFRIAEEAGAKHHLQIYLCTHFGNGVVSIACSPRDEGSLSIEVVKDLMHTFSQATSTFQGNLIVEAAPRAVKEVIDVWGTLSKTVAEVMRGLKAQFDPTYTLNPGRFVAGI